MLTIRLQRTGKRNQADFRIVVAEKESHVSKKVTEILGAYNPRKKVFTAKEDRLKYWLSQRVETSPTMHNLLVDKGFIQSPKVKAFNVPKKPAEAPAAETAKTEAAPAAEAAAPADTPASPADQEKPVEAAPETPAA